MNWPLIVVKKLPFRPDGVSHQTMCTPKEHVELKLHLLSKSLDEILNDQNRHAEFFTVLEHKNNLFAQYFAM